MPEIKLHQLKYEIDTWKRSVEFMVDENIQLKNRIAEILKTGFNRNELEELENFQDQALKEDERIALLRNELAELDRLLVKDLLENQQKLNMVKEKLERLRNNFMVAERQSGELKLKFVSAF